MSGVLELKAVEKSFGAVQVLRGISLAFVPGTVTALVGDNGAGKSTLCKIISGVVPLDAGDVTLAGESITGREPEKIRAAGIEMIYQDLALIRQQDVAANLFLGRELVWGPFSLLRHGEMRKRAAELLKELGVTIPDVSVAVGQLSGGQQQSVAIARALLFSPQVMIMDEPTAALAVREIEQVLTLIRKLKERGIIVILVSHRLNDVFAVSDRVVAIRAGRVVADELIPETTVQRVVRHIVGG